MVRFPFGHQTPFAALLTTRLERGNAANGHRCRYGRHSRGPQESVGRRAYGRIAASDAMEKYSIEKVLLPRVKLDDM